MIQEIMDGNKLEHIYKRDILYLLEKGKTKILLFKK